MSSCKNSGQFINPLSSGDALLLALGPATDTAAQATTPLVASPKLAQVQQYGSFVTNHHGN